MKKLLALLTLLTGLFGMQDLSAQYDVKDTVVFSPNFAFHFAWQWPTGDLEERFGQNGSAGGAFSIKDRKNFHYGLEFAYMFGNTVKEPGLIQNLLTENNEILDDEGKIAILNIQQRGYTVMLTIGKIFPVIGPNQNSGIFVKFGGGFMQHKIRIEHQENQISALEGDYLKGYDRLTNGLCISQFLGYYHMSNSRLANFFVGFESVQGFTEGRRDFNFDTRTVDDEPRLDILTGFRAGWFIPMYKRKPAEFYYY